MYTDEDGGETYYGENDYDGGLPLLMDDQREDPTPAPQQLQDDIQQQQQQRLTLGDAAEDLHLAGDAEETQRATTTTTPKTTSVTGFVTSDGTRRKYDAPEPPKNIEWSAVLPTLRNWMDNHTRTYREETDLLLMLDAEAARDIISMKDTRNALRETLEVTGPFVTVADARWMAGAEDELRRRGIKLADSFVITMNDTIAFGIRAFHACFRYFVLVVLAGDYAPGQLTFDDADGRPVVGLYIVALSKEEAISNRCV